MESVNRYVIFGAGAIGCVIGGLLTRAGLRVVCVARPPQAEALRRGIVVRREGAEEVTVQAEAVTAARALPPAAGDVMIITAKSPATAAIIEELAALYAADTPVVCLQNGVSNEEVAARRFGRVYAGLLFISAVQVEPDLITMPRGGSMAVGLYPEGVDDLARRVSADLSRTGFDTLASAYVMAMKWGKLVANLNNATHAIADYWLERGMADPDMRRLMAAVREEGLRVLDAAGIAVEPPADEPSPLRIRASTEAMRRPPRPAEKSGDTRTYPSTWQDLHLGRPTTEADHLNGEIIRLGQRLAIPTPYNSTLLEIINRMAAEGLKPGLYSAAALEELVRARAAQPPPGGPQPG